MASAAVLGWMAGADMGFRDSGELGAASFVLGVPHPTGFALDVLVLRLGAMLPLGSLAWRQNLTVALVSAAALGLIGHITARLASAAGVRAQGAVHAGAVLAAVGLGTWATFLGTALWVEVYSTALLAVAVAGWAALQGGRHAAVTFLIAGLAAGMHVTVGLMVVPLLLAAFLTVPRAARGKWLLSRVPLVLLGGLIVMYLPLASIRDPAVDWGDPESASALLEHLTAARIRSAYQGEMLGGDAAAALRLLRQLAEQWPLAPLALLGLVFAMRTTRAGNGTQAGAQVGARAMGLVIMCIAVLDLSYAVWANPMGIVDRQVGHVLGASLALFSGVGLAFVCDALWQGLGSERGQSGQWQQRLAPWRGMFRLVAAGLTVALMGALVLRAPAPVRADGYAASELFGSGGALATLPPRAALLCWSDDVCAGGLFATYVEAVRPDVTIAPAQHLWDAAVLARLEHLPQLAGLRSSGPPPSGARRAKARAAVRALAAGWADRPATGATPYRPSPLPLFWETDEPLIDAGYRGPVRVSKVVPLLRVGAENQPPDPAPKSPVQALDELRMARLPRGRAHSASAAAAWSSAYGRVGRGALGSGNAAEAVRAMRRAVQMARFRPQAWTNLGVALHAAGNLKGADEALRKAIHIDPMRPAPWVNLVRFSVARGDRKTAQRILRLAEQAGLSAAQLKRIKAELARKNHH